MQHPLNSWQVRRCPSSLPHVSLTPRGFVESIVHRRNAVRTDASTSPRWQLSSSFLPIIRACESTRIGTSAESPLFGSCWKGEVSSAPRPPRPRCCFTMVWGRGGATVEKGRWTGGSERGRHVDATWMPRGTVGGRSGGRAPAGAGHVAGHANAGTRGAATRNEMHDGRLAMGFFAAHTCVVRPQHVGATLGSASNQRAHQTIVPSRGLLRTTCVLRRHLARGSQDLAARRTCV